VAGASQVVSSGVPDARERILDTAYELFSRRGIRDVGVDEVIERAGVAKATLYRHFGSKDELALEFLRLRERRWTKGWVQAEAERRATAPDEQLLAIFDAFDEWFRSKEFDACAFINVLLEMGWEHELGRASIVHLANIRAFVRQKAEEAGVRDPEAFAHSWHILMKGSIVAASEGDVDAAKRAQAMGRALLDSHRS
jgi:AcrR family transcriptional regulator